MTARNTCEYLSKLHGNSFSYIGKQLHTFLAQWENVQLGDRVEYKPQIIVMKNLFELDKPDPIIEPGKNPNQMEFNFNG